MRTEGYHVETYGSAEAFLDNFSPIDSGCLILDIHMPGMNGVELLEHLQAGGMHIPVIIVTAYKDDALIKRARQAGAYDVVLKPYKDSELLSLIDKTLGERI